MSHFRTGHSDSCMCERCEEPQPSAAEIDELRAQLSAATARASELEKRCLEEAEWRLKTVAAHARLTDELRAVIRELSRWSGADRGLGDTAVLAALAGLTGICSRCKLRPVDGDGSMCTWCGI